MSFNSLYEQLFPFTTIMKQRVVENFSGNTLNERWTEWNEGGSGTFGMVDAVDQGFSILSPSVGNSGIGFNNRRQYAPDGSVCLMVCRAVDTVSFRVFAGFRNIQSAGGASEFAALDINSANANNALFTGDASAGGSTQGSVPVDTSFHVFKIETKAASADLSIDGTLDVTRVINLPTVKTQPQLMSRDDAGGGKETRIKYLEAFNT